jgi:hypothetical protein
MAELADNFIDSINFTEYITYDHTGKEIIEHTVAKPEVEPLPHRIKDAYNVLIGRYTAIQYTED